MAKKKFEIFLMGAPGGGKTVFLSSYFHLTTNLGRGNPVRPKTPEAAEEIERLVKGLLTRRIPEEKKGVEDILFYANSLTALVHLREDLGDLPTSSTPKGIILFLPSDRVIVDPVGVLRENRPYFEALSSFLVDYQSRFQKKEKVPVVFLFTKGDRSPNITEGQLLHKLRELLNPEDPKTAPLAQFLEEEPEKTKCFKVTSVGNWPGDFTMPGEYEPQNVIKPMEELYKTMSNLEVEKKQIKTALIAIVVLLLLTTALTWGMSFRRWSNTEEEVKKLLAASRFEDALVLVDSFGESYVFPDPIPLVPSFLRGGAGKDRTVGKIYSAYEGAEFKALQTLLEGLDTSLMPDVKSEEYLTAAEKAERYLNNSSFKKTNLVNHEKILSFNWYFEAAKGLSGKGANGELAESLTLLESWLAYLPKLPEQWRGEGAKKSVELFTLWADGISPEGSVEDIQRALSEAAKIEEAPNAGEELKNAVAKRKADWEGQVAAKWVERGETWIKEAHSASLEEGIAKLTALLKRDDVPDGVREDMDEALAGSYNSFADAVKNDEKMGAPEIKKILADYPQMPEKARQKLEDRIVAIARSEVETVAVEVESLDSLQALGAAKEKLSLSWADYPEGKEIVAKAFEKTLAALADKELEKLAEQGNALKEKGDFKGSKAAYEGSLEKLKTLLESSGFDESFLPGSLKADDVLGVKLKELREAHLSVCKTDYEKLKAPGKKDEISSVLEELEAFIQLWPGSPEEGEVSSATAYLTAVREGVKGVLIVLAGDFPKEDSFFGSPEFKVSLSRDGKILLETKAASGVKPLFGEKLPFTWDSGTKLEVSAVKVGGLFSSDEKIFNAVLDATGIKGYEKLQGGVKSGENSISLKLEMDLPKSPW